MRAYRDLPSGTLTRARDLRRNATDAEKLLWKAFREKLPHAKFRRQVPHGPYFADFLSFPAKLIVEVDGGQHAEYDAARTRYLESQGFRVLRVWNSDVLQNLEGVLSIISASLSPSPSQASLGPLPLPMGEGFKE
jgi:very-short-patch-repair endonuclease